jgi:hypothetical protein
LAAASSTCVGGEGVICDATLGTKTVNTPQVIDFLDFSGWPPSNDRAHDGSGWFVQRASAATLKQTSRWCHSRSDLADFLAYVILYAPRDFPEEDGLSLAEAMHEIHSAVRRPGDHELSLKLDELAARAHRAYEHGDEVAGPLRGFPNLVTDSEMDALEKLGGIPAIVNSDLHLSRIGRE